MMNEQAWKERYAREVENNIRRAEQINASAPVKTRQMTSEEYEEYFGKKPESVHRLR